MRRECQEILPGLLLGPFQASKSLSALKNLGVTHIVCIRDRKEAFSVKPRFPDQFHYLVLDVEDNEEQNVIRLFPEADQFIQQAMSQGGKVLVHCNGKRSAHAAHDILPYLPLGGISLSPAFVVIPESAVLHLPNGGFLTQIKEYESIYKAKAAVADFPSNPTQRSVSRRKRGNDEDDDDYRIDDRKRVFVDVDDALMATDS
ncbi:phosphotyrosine protein [Pisolithus thermaeus]|nr:phosphotyrosine protein [Pisolithus thermaeus]